jgi:GrpB-like predicted nucleotidyltransferase (UPF0157 family)
LWFDEASRLVSRIAKDLCDLGVKVEHIGSTAVPGLEAKPIIDLIAGLTDQRSVEVAVIFAERVNARHTTDDAAGTDQNGPVSS